MSSGNDDEEERHEERTSQQNSSSNIWSFVAQAAHAVGTSVVLSNIMPQENSPSPARVRANKSSPSRSQQKQRNEGIHNQRSRHGIGLSIIAEHCSKVYSVESTEKGIENAKSDSEVGGDRAKNASNDRMEPASSIASSSGAAPMPISWIHVYEYGVDLAYSQYYPAPLDVYVVVFRGTVEDSRIQWVQNLTSPLSQLSQWALQDAKEGTLAGNVAAILQAANVGGAGTVEGENDGNDAKERGGAEARPGTATGASAGHTRLPRLHELGWEANAHALLARFVDKQIELQQHFIASGGQWHSLSRSSSKSSLANGHPGSGSNSMSSRAPASPSGSKASESLAAAAQSQNPPSPRNHNSTAPPMVSPDLTKSKYIFCGHSRGGLLATLAAAQLNEALKERDLHNLPASAVHVVGFGMPVFEPFSLTALNRIETVSCYVHANDAVGMHNVERGHVDLHMSHSALQRPQPVPIPVRNSTTQAAAAPTSQDSTKAVDGNNSTSVAVEKADADTTSKGTAAGSAASPRNTNIGGPRKKRHDYASDFYTTSLGLLSSAVTVTNRVLTAVSNSATTAAELSLAAHSMDNYCKDIENGVYFSNGNGNNASGKHKTHA